MNFSSFIYSKKYNHLLNRTHILNGMYIVLMCLILLSIMVAFISSTAFLLRILNGILWVSEKDIASSVALFDTEKIASFAPKLGINVSLISGMEEPRHIPLQSEISSPQPSIVSQEAPYIDKKALHLRILNGTLIPGLAKQWSDWYTEQGFTHITVGNAPERNYTRFKIIYSVEKKHYLDALREVIALHKGSVPEEVEDNALSAEITIIIGMP